MITTQISAKVKTNDPAKPRAIRAGLGAAFSNIGSLPSTKSAQAVAKHVAETNGEFGVGSLAGDVWWEVKDAPIVGSDETRNGFMAEKHKGETLMLVTLDEESPVKPPLPDDLSVRVVVDIYPESKTIEVNSTHDLTGFTVVVNGTPFVKDVHG